jgi:hypothetical protein
MPSFSLAALTVLELAPPALIDVAAACGYDHVGIRLLPAMAGGIAYPLMEDQGSLKETLARLEATCITVADLEVVAIRPETEIESFAAFSKPANGSAPAIFWSPATIPISTVSRIALRGSAKPPPGTA